MQVPPKILQFLCADIGDYINFGSIEDFLAREIITINVVKPDGSVGKRFTLAPAREEKPELMSPLS